MKNVITLLTGAAFALCSVEAFSQQTQIQIAQGDVKVKKIELELQPTPQFQANVKDKKIPNQKNWLEMDIEFEADVKPRDAIIPKLMFRFYVALKDKDAQNVVLSGETTYLNIDSSEDNFAACYVSPQELYKLTEKKTFNKGDVIGHGVEIFYNGVLVGLETTNGKFWEQIPGRPGILGRDQTPFGLLWIDRYPDIEKK